MQQRAGEPGYALLYVCATIYLNARQVRLRIAQAAPARLLGDGKPARSCVTTSETLGQAEGSTTLEKKASHH